jgi:Na+-translocating ferredoxin:NAD+ oxidoreductase RnfD subunit
MAHATTSYEDVPWWARGRQLDSRYLIAGLITLVLVLAQARYHMVGGYERLALTLLTCVAAEAALSWFDRGRVVNLLSAYISGISLTLLLKPQGGALWPFVIGGVLAIASKYVLRYRDNHLWNPTNFAIVVRVLHITLTYVASFLALSTLRSLALGQPVLPELAPITGPMYQLFVFFMITDPRTVVRGRRRQIAVAIVVAVVEALIRLASDRGWPLPIAFNAAPPLVALWLVGPAAKWIDLRRASKPRREAMSYSTSDPSRSTSAATSTVDG